MKRTRNQWSLWLAVISVFLMSLAACSSPKEAPYLPEQYLDWSVAVAAINMKNSKVVKSEIIVTLEGKSIQLDYENGKLKESVAISQKTTQLSARDLVKCLETSAKEYKEIVQNDTVRIGIIADLGVFESFSSMQNIYLYDIDSGKLTETIYDGEGGIAWGSIMDGENKQIYTLILR